MLQARIQRIFAAASVPATCLLTRQYTTKDLGRLVTDAGKSITPAKLEASGAEVTTARASCLPPQHDAGLEPSPHGAHRHVDSQIRVAAHLCFCNHSLQF